LGELRGERRRDSGRQRLGCEERRPLGGANIFLHRVAAKARPLAAAVASPRPGCHLHGRPPLLLSQLQLLPLPLPLPLLLPLPSLSACLASPRLAQATRLFQWPRLMGNERWTNSILCAQLIYIPADVANRLVSSGTWTRLNSGGASARPALSARAAALAAPPRSSPSAARGGRLGVAAGGRGGRNRSAPLGRLEHGNNISTYWRLITDSPKSKI